MLNLAYSLRAAELYQKAAAALDNTNDPNRVKRSTYFSEAGSCLDCAAQEAQREQPREEIIDVLHEAAQLYQQAAAALENINNPDRELRSDYLNKAAYALLRAAQEAQTVPPRQDIIKESIKLFHEAAQLYQQALAALDNTNDPNRELRSDYLHNAAYTLFIAAEEDCAENPNQTYISNPWRQAQKWKDKAAAL